MKDGKKINISPTQAPYPVHTTALNHPAEVIVILIYLLSLDSIIKGYQKNKV